MLSRIVARYVLVAAPLVMCFCNVGQESSKSLASDVTDLRLTSSDVSGWSERTMNGYSGYGVYVGQDLCGSNNPIDGACKDYTDRGVLKTVIQLLQSPSPVQGNPALTLDAYAMDFGTAAAASAMFTYKSNGASTTMSGYADTVVVINANTPSFGCTVYAHFGKFYLELAFNNYTVKSDALDDAKAFIDVYNRKIDG